MLRAWDIARLALNVVGVAVMVYLTAVHFSTEELLACPGSGVVDCQAVLASDQSELFGIPIAIVGIAWFLIAGAFAVASLRYAGDEPPLFTNGAMAWTFTGVLFALYLIYAELVWIHAICLWCTVAHLVIGAMMVIQVLTHPMRSGGRYPPDPR